MIADPVFGAPRAHAARSTESADPSVAIAVLSWAWAAVAVGAATPAPTGRDEWTASRWLAAHPADASLVARLAGQLW